jgi:signal transduction histidine kinase
MPQKLASTRLKILYWVLLPLLVGMGASWGAAAVLLNQQAEAEIFGSIGSEAQELRVIAEQGSDPVTGQTFGSAKALLEYFMSTRVPHASQAILAIVDGEPFIKRSADELIDIELNAEFVAAATSTSPVIGRFPTNSGEVIFGSVPLNSPIDSGNFVVLYLADGYKSNYQLLLLELGAISLASILIALGLGWLAAGRVLRPIRDLGATARRISDQNLTERIPISDRERSSELGGIAGTFNRMMDRIQEGFLSQRKFVDDAGHELRTPLTIIRGNLDLHKRSLNKESQTLDVAIDEVNRMSLLVADLQTLTSSSSPDFLRNAEFALGDLLDELLVKAESLGERNWSLSARPEIQVSGDKFRLTQAALQLVENAVKQTSPGDKIQISGLESADGFSIVIEDSGPGIPAEERDAIRNRFVRGTNITPDVPGSGLGLAVVSAIAEAHRGNLFLEDSTLGGLRARIWIPARAAEAVTR